MADHEELQVQVYSIRPLTERAFELPGDPYDNGETPESLQAIALLRAWGVVFYRDEDHSRAVILEPDNVALVPICEQSGWSAFKSHCVLDGDTLKVLEWRGTEAGAGKRKQKAGDLLQWLTWNQRCVVVQMNETTVRVV